MLNTNFHHDDFRSIGMRQMGSHFARLRFRLKPALSLMPRALEVGQIHHMQQVLPLCETLFREVEEHGVSRVLTSMRQACQSIVSQ